MAFRWTTLGTMTDEEAKREIVQALEATQGNFVRAAHLLGLRTRRQLYRYMHKIPGMWEEADRVRQRAWDDFVAARRRLGYKGEHGARAEPGS